MTPPPPAGSETVARRRAKTRARSRRPVPARLTGLNLATAGVALVLTGALLTGAEYFMLRRAHLEDLEVKAAMLAENSAAAVMFADRGAGEDMLGSLSRSPHVRRGILYIARGDPLAFYQRPDQARPATLPEIAEDGHRFQFERLQLVRPVSVDGRRIGTIYLEADMAPLYARLLGYVATVVLVAFSALGGALLLVSRFRKAIGHAEEQLDYLAHYDAVTDLPNRNLFNLRLGHALAHARGQERRVALVFFDLDDFKLVNDTHGHQVGDLLLQQTAERLRNALSLEDVVCRIGGDEFAIIVDEVPESPQAAAIAERIQSVFALPFTLAGHVVYIGASIGISVFPKDGDTPETLLRNADTAMYHAKDTGKNNYQFFSPDMNFRTARRLATETGLRGALEREELLLHYQPIVALASNRIVGVEALLRWRDPRNGLVLPGEFIPVAEQTGLILPLGEWALHAACAQLRAWMDQGYTRLGVNVNLSSRQFRAPHLPDMIAAILKETGVAADQLELEITEGTLMDHSEVSIRRLEHLRAMGLRLAIDDFGTGYSSMSYLKRFPINRLKIDKGFIHDIPADRDDAAITAAVIALAGQLGIESLAEGVETAEQLRFLVGCGCQMGQGNHFGTPRSAQEMRPLFDDYGVESPPLPAAARARPAGRGIASH